MPFYIENPTTGLVLDIKDCNRSSRARVVMWSYNGGSNQLWEYRNGCIYSKLNGLVLDISGDDKRSLITFDHHGRSNQKWSFNHDGTIQCGTGQVLDIRDASRSQGADVIAWTKNGNWNQKFRQVPA